MIIPPDYCAYQGKNSLQPPLLNFLSEYSGGKYTEINVQCLFANDLRVCKCRRVYQEKTAITFDMQTISSN